MIVTNAAYRGNGATYTFDNGKVVNTVYKVVDGVLTYTGLTDEQAAAVRTLHINADDSVEVASPAVAGLVNAVSHQRHFFGDDISVRFTEESPVADPSGYTGWHFDNTGGGKIAWYIYSMNQILTPEPPTTLRSGNVKSLWASLRMPTGFDPTSNLVWFTVFTRRKNDGQDVAINYRSRFTFLADWDLIDPREALMYYGEDPGVRPELVRVKLELLDDSFGPQEDDEEILNISLSTNSSAAAGDVKFTIQEAGLKISNYSLGCTFAMP